MDKTLHIIGGGLAGCEAAYRAAECGIKVHVYEMRPHVQTFAHKTPLLAELVCSNSFRSDEWEHNAVGLLHHELRLSGSLIMQAADKARLPAGAALGVDRDIFSQYIDNIIHNHPNITVINKEITSLDEFIDKATIIATGPLTSDALMTDLRTKTGEQNLSFFDAIAPIIHEESIDTTITWRQSRWDKGKDYINCPMDKQQYDVFYNALCNADVTQFKEWEKNTPYFEGCLPIEIMANRGYDTLRYGPMKPIGLTNPHNGQSCFAVVQLRQDNEAGTLWNMVGFQTKMTYGAQKEVFQTIPGLERAEFARLGGIHRNSFIKSPCVLDAHLRIKATPNIMLAGQITGVEGYVESTAIGLMASYIAINTMLERDIMLPPNNTAFGALLRHVTHGDSETFQPMNMNYGLLPPPPLKDNGKKYKGQERKQYLSLQAVKACKEWLVQTRT